VPSLNFLTDETRKTFLYEMSLIGDVLLKITDAIRINYEMVGNLEPALHAHIFPRYKNEPEELKLKPAWFYDWDSSPSFDFERDRPLMEKIKVQLEV